jgi:Trk K+ transport system NAD-binding subunit
VRRVADRRRVLLVGRGDLAEEVCEALDAAGAEVSWLEHADDESLRDAVGAKPDAVCVATRDDAFPLRIALLVRHLDEDVPLVVTIFDPGIARQIADTIPSCHVTSVADIVAPSLAGPCISPDLLAVLRDRERTVGLDERLEEVELPTRQAHRARSLATAVFRPYDRSAALLFYGAAGLVAMFCFELFGAMIVLEQGFADAFYGTAKSVATVGPNTDVDDGPKWFKVAVGCSVILTLLSAACFTGGLINRLVDSRLTGLIGKRAVPRHNHVIVIGLGQVGLRLCMLLRECGVLVVAIDADEDAETVGLARRLRIPVVVGRAANPEILRRLSVRSARAFAAVTNEDLANIESAMTARSLNPDVRVVLRAGDGDVSEETQSLARIGHVVDVHRLAAAYIAGVALGSDADSVALRDGKAELLLPGGARETAPLVVAR